MLTFRHFLLFDPDDAQVPSFSELAPQLARRIYSTNVRVLMDDLDDVERSEVEAILARAKNTPPSPAGDTITLEQRDKCAPRESTAIVKGCSR